MVRLPLLGVAVVTACLLATNPCSAETAFFIGNSFTRNCQPASLPAFAAEGGKELTTGWHIKNGSPLHNIWGSPSSVNDVSATFNTFAGALPNHQWDAVTLQPFYKGDYQGFGPATMRTDISSIKSFINLTRQNPANVDTKFYVYTSWPLMWLGKPYQQVWDGPVTDDLSTWSYHQRDYYEHLINRVRAETDAEVNMVPIGEVMYELDKKMQAGELPGYDGIGDIMADGLHLDAGLGEYLASATVYATIFGESPAGLTKPAGHYDGGPGTFTPEVYDVFHETVWNVVSTHEYAGVPEPATLSMLALGAAAVLLRRRREIR